MGVSISALPLPCGDTPGRAHGGRSEAKRDLPVVSRPPAQRPPLQPSRPGKQRRLLWSIRKTTFPFAQTGPGLRSEQDGEAAGRPEQQGRGPVRRAVGLLSGQMHLCAGCGPQRWGVPPHLPPPVGAEREAHPHSPGPQRWADGSRSCRPEGREHQRPRPAGKATAVWGQANP